MQKQMAGLGLDFDFVDATDGRLPLSATDIDLMGGEKMLRRYEGYDHLTGGAIGCTISHLRCYKKLLSSHHPHALILEDDALLLDDFVPVLNALLKHPRKWNQIRLGHAVTHKRAEVMPFFGKGAAPLNIFLRHRLIPDGPTANSPYYWGPAAIALDLTHAYLITREGSEFALKHYPAIPPMPIDNLMSHYPMPRQFVISPVIAEQNALSKSAIAIWEGNTRFTLIGANAKQTSSIDSTQAGTKLKIEDASLPSLKVNSAKSGIKALLNLLLSSKQKDTLMRILFKFFYTYSLFYAKGYTMITGIKLHTYQKKMHKVQR